MFTKNIYIYIVDLYHVVIYLLWSSNLVYLYIVFLNIYKYILYLYFVNTFFLYSVLSRVLNIDEEEMKKYINVYVIA